jgi:putative drug exporter of the RND superfamily
MRTNTNITQRLARASARRRWAVAAAWALAVLLSAAGIAGLLGTALTTDDDFTGQPEAQRAEQVLERAFPPKRASEGFEVDETVIVTSPHMTADDPRFDTRLDTLAADLRAAGAAEIEQGPVSRDGHSALLLVELGRDVEPVVERVAAANGRDGFEALIVGEESIDEDFSAAAEEDLARGELFGLALALLVLIVVFRGWWPPSCRSRWRSRASWSRSRSWRASARPSS